MNTVNPAVVSQKIASDYYSLLVNHFPQETKITMSLSITQVNTIDFPKTIAILQKLLPGVLSSVCFNELSLPFHEEARKTEIGHLFEHILLEYLCLEKSMLGIESEYNGVTSWNWKTDPYGTFHIVVDAGIQDKQYLQSAINKAITLMTFIITSHSTFTNYN